MPLTNTAVHNSKPKDKPYKMTDGGGMYLLVNKSGAKYWRYDYRINSKRKTLALGVYPQTSIKEAREKLKSAKKLVERDIDPSDEKKRLADIANKEKRKGKTFEEAAREWVAFKSHPDTKRCWKERHKQDVVARLEADVFPVIGYKVLKRITIDDVEAVLKPIIARNALEVADRALGRMDATFRYSRIKRWCANNPADGLREIQPKRKTKHMAFLKKEDLPEFLTTLDKYQGDFVCKSALEFVLLTHVRTDEIRFVTWDEIDFENRVWNIPAKRMKMNIAQAVPLSTQAIKIIHSVKPLTGTSKYIFASLIRLSKPISENGMLSSLYNMGYKGITTVHGRMSIFGHRTI